MIHLPRLIIQESVRTKIQKTRNGCRTTTAEPDYGGSGSSLRFGAEDIFRAPLRRRHDGRPAVRSIGLQQEVDRKEIFHGHFRAVRNAASHPGRRPAGRAAHDAHGLANQRRRFRNTYRPRLPLRQQLLVPFIRPRDSLPHSSSPRAAALNGPTCVTFPSVSMTKLTRIRPCSPRSKASRG